MGDARECPEELFVCMGSACHQLGVYDVLPRHQELLCSHELDGAVELKGAFCLDDCADGIVLKHRDRLFRQVNRRNVDRRFAEEILPCLRLRNGEGGA